ncbi:MAG TPA: ATP-binding protein [Candidatus Binatia bacterium]|jgi:signal transduction histidine kinase|nr:ATP-binding protein [Candidatus Binatia bacterium]
MPSSSERELRALVLAPRGRDARVIREVLQQAGMRAEICATVEDLGQQLQAGAGAAVLTTEALTMSRIQILVQVLDRQPAWSALPFLLLTGGGASTRTSMRQLALLEQLKTITLLERPLRKVTLVSAVQEALRLRRRQYEIRNYLAERQHREAQLRQANDELQQFAYVASHDLQEPLRMVTSYVQLLAQRYQGQLDAEAEEFISYAVEGAQHMRQLIQDLLAYTRVGGTAPEWTAVDCEAVLARTVHNLHLLIEEMQAEVSHDPLPTVRGEAQQVGLVFQNLLGNALKFHGAAPPRIHVSARPEGAMWVFAVQDNGIGMEARQAERIFQVFQRLHTRREYPGTGIGLAICKKIVERHGGRLWVESEPGKGATFFFTLPANDGG